MRRRLTREAERDIEELFDARIEMETLFDLIVVEFESDPTSVQCFDLRVVDRAKLVNAKLKRLKKKVEPFY